MKANVRPELQKIGETKSGYDIFVELNESGGHRYWTANVDGGGFGAVIWDASIASVEELQIAMAYEHFGYSYDQYLKNIIAELEKIAPTDGIRDKVKKAPELRQCYLGLQPIDVLIDLYKKIMMEQIAKKLGINIGALKL